MKLIEQLQSPKLWSVIIGLLVSAGLLQFSDSQAGEVAGSLAGLFTALGMVVMAVLSQKGDNDAKVETVRGVSRDVMAREITLSEPRGVLMETEIEGRYSELWLELDRLKQQVRELEQARTIAANNVHIDRRGG